MTAKTGKLAHAITNAVTHTPPPAKRKRLFDSSNHCEWFAHCENHMVRYRDHPILGQVAICQRCDEKVDRLS